MGRNRGGSRAIDREWPDSLQQPFPAAGGAGGRGAGGRGAWEPAQADPSKLPITLHTGPCICNV